VAQGGIWENMATISLSRLMVKFSAESKLKGNMRKLAREAVIFCFVGALIAGVVGLVRERGRILAEQGEPCSLIHDYPDNPRWNDAVLVGPCNMDGKLIPQLTKSMCIADLIDGKCSQLSAEGKAAEAKAESIRVSWKDVPRLLEVLAFFAFLLGFPGGFVVWSVYRLARFAVTG